MNPYLTQFRLEIDDFMQFHPQSPLVDEDRDNFAGLEYYDENPELALTVEVTPLPEDEKLVEMETSTGDLRLFRRWGQFSFTVEGEEATLTIYSDPDGEEFFLPFKDTTNGTDTYGAGRYLDNHRPGLAQIEDTTFEVDLNYSYNPYCAYNLAYSCPLPPRENWLKVPIRAGEKDFHAH
jgi:uncharacterized protein (DUF1684 family)